MKFAFLGEDRELLRLADAVISAGHSLSWFGEVGALAEAFKGLAAGAEHDGDWEVLLGERLAQVVVVGRGVNEDHRADQLRRLVQAGRPVLLSHPACGSLLYYELGMIAVESGSLMRYHVGSLEHPAVVRLDACLRCDQAPVGELQQVELRRCLWERSKDRVRVKLARDIELLQKLCGDFDRIGALGAPQSETAYQTLGVQMSGPSAVVARWSVAPAEELETATLTAFGSEGRLILVMPSSEEPWTLTMRAGGQMIKETFDGGNALAAAIGDIVTAVECQANDTNWNEAARSMELAEAIDVSLQKGRTVHLYGAEYTEASTFKGKMATVGCLLLVATPLVAGLVGVGDLLNLPFLRHWSALLLAVLLVFLGLQLLLGAAVGRSVGTRDAHHGVPPESS